MNTIILAGIDPGGTTGLAIAKALVTDKQVSLREVNLGSWKEPSQVLELIFLEHVQSIIMEKRAQHPHSHAGLSPYEQIKFGLEELGYKPNPKGFQLNPMGIVLITPGIWKPVMEQLNVDYGSWIPTTPHEWDALKILHYGLRINSLRKMVMYE